MKNLNKLLTNKDRKLLQPSIDIMFQQCPETMAKKISEANVQQAFILDTVIDLHKEFDRTLCVGAFEDTADETLNSLGYPTTGIDPAYNMDLKEYHSTMPGHFNIIFSTSVIEHVEDDEAFLSYMCDLLIPGGYGILTCDFRDSYKSDDVVPATVVRQYTKHDLEERLVTVLDRYECKLVGDPDWSGEPDFLYQGHWYSFATYVFRKDVYNV